MADTKIEWAKKVWNPTIGCTKCSPGCLNCYAERMAKRLYWMGMEEPATLPEYMKFKDGWKNGHIELCNHRLDQPLHWRKPSRIFVCSMSDMFHEKVPFEFIDKVRHVMWKCLHHTFLVLTKRPKCLYEYCEEKKQDTGVWANNVQLGVSISTYLEMWKVDVLEEIPAAIRYVSLEPLLEEVPLKIGKLDWVVVGCESGPKRRPCKIEWIERVVEQCKSANVPVFVKQINQDGKVVKMPKDYPQEYPS